MSKKEGLQTETNWYDRSAKVVGSVAALAVATGGRGWLCKLGKRCGCDDRKAMHNTRRWSRWLGECFV